MKKEKNEKKRKRSGKVAWDKLDNTANLFPVIATQEMTNVYRISVSLKEKVVPAYLEQALEKVLPWFRIFRMRLREGFFWYYFEENQKKIPRIEQEHTYPGMYINRSRNRSYMFRVSYYENRINLEVFHALTDGSGAILFLKELLYQYLRLCHPELLEEEKDQISSGLALDKEDSYVKNFKKGHSRVYSSKKAFLIDGEQLAKGEIGVIHGYLPVTALKEACRTLQVTINELLVGVMTYSIYRECLSDGAGKYPIAVSVPVNLRPFYDSYTMKNFFAMVSAQFAPEKEEYDFAEVLAITTKSLREQITPQNLNDILSYNVSNEKNLVLRSVPLFIKKLVMKRVYGVSARASSTTITNMGNITLRDAYQKYVEHFYVTLSMSKGQKIKGGVCSYQGTLVFTFSSVLEDVTIQKRFFRTLQKLGVPVAIESNGVYDE